MNYYELFFFEIVNWTFYVYVIEYLKIFDESLQTKEAGCYTTISQAISVYTGLYAQSNNFLQKNNNDAVKNIS